MCTKTALQIAYNAHTVHKVCITNIVHRSPNDLWASTTKRHLSERFDWSTLIKEPLLKRLCTGPGPHIQPGRLRPKVSQRFSQWACLDAEQQEHFSCGKLFVFERFAIQSLYNENDANFKF